MQRIRTQAAYALVLLSLVLVLLLAAAGPAPAASADEPMDWQAKRDAYDDLRTRYYEDASYDRALAAAALIFELADQDYRVATLENGVIAHRTWAALPGEDPGEAWWYVAVGKTGDGRVAVRARLSPEPDPNGPQDVSQVDPGRLDKALINPTETTAYELVGTDGAVGLFLMRMDWLMGKNPYWLYCSAAREYAKISPWEGSLDAFCRQADDVRADRVPLHLPE